MKIVISGALGRMGKAVAEAAYKNGVEVLAGIDIKDGVSPFGFKIVDSFDKLPAVPDCIVDFSSPKVLDSIISYAEKNSVPCVICTTGYDSEGLDKIDGLSKKVAVFRSANMSLGANVLIALANKTAKLLSGFDVEIIEKHHNQKVDAPSGTALMIADSIKSACEDKTYIYGRQGIVGKRSDKEIGIHAVRGGNIVGEHEVLFIGENETVSLKHEATNREVFANGAITAAKFLAGKKSGKYNMQDIIKV